MTKKEFNKKTKGMTTFDSFLKEQMKNPKFKKEYLALGPEFDSIESVIRKRIKSGLTQKQLAKKLGTKQSAISRFEGGEGNPTLSFMNNVAVALGATLKIIVK